MTKLLSFLLLAFVFVGYQNCGKQMDFTASSDKVSINEDAEVGPIPDVDNDIDLGEDDKEEVNDDDSNDNEEEVVDEDSNDNDENDSDDGEEVAEEENGNSCHDKSKASYICILDGNGKSQRLGYSDSQLIVNGSTPQTVCTTKKACLEIVSQKFDVVSAEYRGFCKKGGGHSVALSESELEALVSK